jgi:hypothetical protein
MGLRLLASLVVRSASDLGERPLERVLTLK